MTLRVLVIPLFERTPLHLDDRLTPKDDHVVVAGYERDSEVLLAELETLDVDYVLLEDDDEAKRLSDDGYQAINGDPEELADLERAGIRDAELLITDAGEATASVALTALEANPDLGVVSFVESTRRKSALTAIGVDRAIAPHALIGRRLAEKATTPVSVEGTDGDDDVAIREILVRRGSGLDGVLLSESPLAGHPDLTVVAGWFDGELRIPPSPTDRLSPNAVLVVAGPEGEIDAAAGDVAGVRDPVTGRDKVVVAGLGEGGAAAVDALPPDVPVTTVDILADVGADIVGDATEVDTLRAAGLADAASLVVTVDDDATALLTIAVARSLAPGVEILARVTESEKTGPAVSAGADYVLSVQRVSARLVAAEVHGERVMDPVSQIRLVRVAGKEFAGESLTGAAANPGGGWRAIALSRNGTVHTDDTTTIRAGDEVFVAGSDDAIRQLDRTIDAN